MAMLTPLFSNIRTSFGMSPMVAISPAGLLNVLFAFRHAVVVVADADNLRHTAEETCKRLHHARRKFHRPLLALDVRSLRVADVPSGVRIHPHVETVIFDGLDHFLRN